VTFALKSLAVAGVFALAAAGVVVAAEAKLAGYLTAGSNPPAQTYLGPPPAPDSPQGQGDRALFEKTRALKDSPRWTVAQADADIDPRSAGRLFDCPLGANLGQNQPAAITRLLTRIEADVASPYNAAKDFYKRPRPVVGNDLPICVAKDDHLTHSFSYPSGHSSISWAWTLAMAEMEPDRAGEIVRRGAAIGDSRVVCGVHFMSDVEAGRRVGSAVFAAEQSSPEFQADLKAAKTEIDARRAAGQQNPACTAEAEALKASIQ
jgi:acid phosphatase (class A)